MGPELQRDAAEPGPDHDTGPFRCNVPLHKTRTAIPHAVPKSAARLPAATDRRVTEDFAQHWKLLLSVPSPARAALISETSTWAETIQLLP